MWQRMYAGAMTLMGLFVSAGFALQLRQEHDALLVVALILSLLITGLSMLFLLFGRTG